MKGSGSIGLVLAGIAIGVIIGRLAPGSGSSGEDGGSAQARMRSSIREHDPRGGAVVSGVARIRHARPHELAGLTRLAASTPDPVERHRLVSECLLHMTAENWFDVVSGFHKLSCETGRDPSEEWKLALVRSGQVAGAEAMDRQLAEGLDKTKRECWSILYGWANRDPLAALDWLKTAEAAGHAIPAENYAAALAGAALGDPRSALDLLGRIPEHARQDCIDDLVSNAVQNGGADALDTIIEYAAGLDTSTVEGDALSDLLYHHSIEKLLWKADLARDVNQAREIIGKIAQYDRSPTKTAHQVFQKYRWYAVPDKLDILDAATASANAELDVGFLTSALAETMFGEGDRAAALEWMAKHPDSPFVPHLEQITRANP
jgi:hypothetical protein